MKKEVHLKRGINIKMFREYQIKAIRKREQKNGFFLVAVLPRYKGNRIKEIIMYFQKKSA